MALIAPSVLSANFGSLSKDIDMINKSSADYFHVDIMDGVFVPNISFGFPILKILQKEAKKPLDVHLMIENPDKFLVEFKNIGADILTVHLEAVTHLHRTISEIKNLGMKAGVAINPHTPIETLRDIISDLDWVIIMSVNPGFGGQSFIENTYQKTESLKNLILQKNSSALIEIDGGVNLQNAAKLQNVGADVLVAGNAIFSDNNPYETIQKFKNI